MEDHSAKFPIDPVIGWVTSNYRDRARNGEVQQMQGFPGYRLDGSPIPDDGFDKDLVAVPEAGYHTSLQFFRPTPEQAIIQARERVQRMVEDQRRIVMSILAAASADEKGGR